MPKKKLEVTIKPNKLALWLKHFTDESCSTTFLNKTESARQAKYNATEDSLRTIGCQNFTKLQDKITIWLDEHGLSENTLKAKLLSLVEAKETKFFSSPVKDGNGIVTDIFVKEIEVEAIETQRRTLDMVLKVKGLYAPERHELIVKPLITYKNTAQDQFENDSGKPQITDE